MNETVLQKMIEIEPVNNDGFLQILETLTRMGLIKRGESGATLYQTVCLLHKQGRYFLAHFKQMYQLDGRLDNTMTDEDHSRLHNIANLLKSWNLVNPLSAIETYNEQVRTVVIKHADKDKFKFEQPYKIGK